MADLERRKHVRIRFRPDLRVVPQRHEGRQSFVVKDPIGLRYYRFSEREQFLLQLLDGGHTLEEVRQAFEARYRPARLTLEEVESFAQQALTAGLANSGTTTGQALLRRRRRHERGRRLGRLANVLAFPVPLFDPDRLLTRLLPWARWLFTPAAFAGVALLALAALLLVATHFDVFRDRLPAAREFFSLRTAGYLWLALGLVKVLHEFGHGLCCKAYGGEVHEMGLLLLFFSPCLYCDVSDAWTLPDKRRRAAIGLAGIYVELLIAAVATFIWWNAPDRPFLGGLCLGLMTICGVSTVLLNGNPLLRYDGYYVLADWLEVPNLHTRATGLFRKLLLKHALGVEVTPEPPLAEWRRWVFLAYAVASPIYRALVLVGIGALMYVFLRPFGLAWVGLLMPVVAVVCRLIWPLWGLVRAWGKRGGRVPAMKPIRVVLSAGLVAAAVAAFFLVPLPLAGVRQVGVVEVRPEAVAPVFVPSTAVLVRLHVRNGQHVAAGELLAEFQSPDLENQRATARCQRDLCAVALQCLRERAAAADPSERARVQAPLARALGDCARAAEQVQLADRLIERLRLRAPRAGVVVGLPGVEDIGRTWEKGTPTPLCTIADPRQAWVLLPLDPPDYRLLKDDLEAARRGGSDLRVLIHYEGRSQLAAAGKVVQLFEPEAEGVPAALTQWAGGPVAARPVRSGGYTPQSQHYWVAVAPLDADEAVGPGMTARVRIRCRGRTAAWTLWRMLCSAFDVELI